MGLSRPVPECFHLAAGKSLDAPEVWWLNSSVRPRSFLRPGLGLVLSLLPGFDTGDLTDLCGLSYLLFNPDLCSEKLFVRSSFPLQNPCGMM